MHTFKVVLLPLCEFKSTHLVCLNWKILGSHKFTFVCLGINVKTISDGKYYKHQTIIIMALMLELILKALRL